MIHILVGHDDITNGRPPYPLVWAIWKGFWGEESRCLAAGMSSSVQAMAERVSELLKEYEVNDFDILNSIMTPTWKPSVHVPCVDLTDLELSEFGMCLKEFMEKAV